MSATAALTQAHPVTPGSSRVPRSSTVSSHRNRRRVRLTKRMLVTKALPSPPRPGRSNSLYLQDSRSQTPLSQMSRGPGPIYPRYESWGASDFNWWCPPSPTDSQRSAKQGSPRLLSAPRLVVPKPRLLDDPNSEPLGSPVDLGHGRNHSDTPLKHPNLWKSNAFNVFSRHKLLGHRKSCSDSAATVKTKKEPNTPPTKAHSTEHNRANRQSAESIYDMYEPHLARPKHKLSSLVPKLSKKPVPGTPCPITVPYSLDSANIRNVRPCPESELSPSPKILATKPHRDSIHREPSFISGKPFEQQTPTDYHDKDPPISLGANRGWLWRLWRPHVKYK